MRSTHRFFVEQQQRIYSTPGGVFIVASKFIRLMQAAYHNIYAFTNDNKSNLVDYLWMWTMYMLSTDLILLWLLSRVGSRRSIDIWCWLSRYFRFARDFDSIFSSVIFSEFYSMMWWGSIILSFFISFFVTIHPIKTF